MKFYVGQKVRLVRPWASMLNNPIAMATWNKIKGKEGVVYSLSMLNSWLEPCISVQIDGEGYACPDYGLEPIQPEGHTPLESWDECPWKPEHMREEVYERA